MTYSELAHAEWLVREAKKALTNGQHVEYAHLEHAQEIIRRVKRAVRREPDVDQPA